MKAVVSGPVHKYMMFDGHRLGIQASMNSAASSPRSASATAHLVFRNHMRQDISYDDLVHADPMLFQRFIPEIPHRTSGEILLHPEFAQLRRRYVIDTTENYTKAVFPGGCQCASYHVIVLGALMSLYEGWDRLNPQTLPTLSRLKRIVAAANFSSPRHVDNYVHRLAQTKDLVLEHFETDGRIRLIRPTEKLLSWCSLMTASYYRILDELYPTPGYQLAVTQNDAFMKSQRAASRDIFEVIGGFMARNEDMLPFHSMNLGGIVLLRLSIAEGEDPADDEAGSFTTLKAKYGISRSHYRNVLVAAEERGLLSRSIEKGKRPRLNPRGRFAVDRFIADTLASHDMSFHLATMKTGARQPGVEAVYAD